MLTLPNANDPDIPTLVKVRIHDGSEWHSFGNYGDHERIFGIQLSIDIDNPSWQCGRLEFRNRPDLGPSLDPDDPSSDFNDGTIADTLLHPKHKMEVLLSKDYGSTWVQKFRGEVGKPTGRRKVDRDDIITISPKDASLPLKEPVIEGVDATKQQPYVFEDIYIEDLIDEIVQLKGHNISLDRTNSDIPDFLIRRDEIKGITPWKAAQNVAQKVGHKLTFRNVGVGDGIKLVLFDPDRGKTDGRLQKGDSEWTVDETFAGGWDIRETEKDQMDVRTGCRVHYVDKNLGQHSVFVEDEWALENYGARDYAGGTIPRNMVLVEDDKSHIDTEVEARNYAQYNLDDQNAPESTVDYGVRHAHPGLQLYDILEFTGSQDYDVQMVATDISIEVGYEDKQRGDTQIHGTMERVRGSREYWFEMGHLPDEISAYRGDQKPPPAPEDPPTLTKSNYIDDTEVERAKVKCGGEHNPAHDVIGYRWRFREIIDGEKEEWQRPSDTGEPTTVIRGLDVGTNIELEVQYQAKDFETSYPSGVEGDGEWSPSGFISLYPDGMPPAPPENVTTSSAPQAVDINWDNPTTNKDGSNLNDLGTIKVFWNIGSDFSNFDPDDDTTYGGKQDVGTPDNWTHQVGAGDKEIWYKLVAYDKVSNKSTPTASIKGSTGSSIGDNAAPSTPTNLTVTENDIDFQEDGTVYAYLKLNWDDNPEVDIAGYEIAVSPDDTNWDIVDSVESSEYTLKPLMPNEDYYVRIRATDTEDNVSDWTSSVSVTTARDTDPPDTPTGLSANNQIGGVEFTWDENTELDFKHYVVEVDKDDDGTYEKEFTTRSTSFTIPGTYGTTMTIRLAAKDTSNNVSGTVTASGTPQLIQQGDSVLDLGQWSFGGTFSSSDYNTVAWTSGTLEAGGKSFSINSGDTGNMSSLTYIYYIEGNSNFSTTTNFNDTLGNDRILIAAAEDVPETGKEAQFQVYQGAASLGFQPYIVSEYIETDAITANEADLTSIFSSSITINSGGYIESSDYDGSANGFRINADGTAEFYEVTVEGSVTITGGSGVGNLNDAGALAEKDAASWDTDLTNIPDRHTDSATVGLNLTSSYLGYYDGSTWQGYIAGADGSGQLAGGDIQWDGTGNVQIKGSLTVTGGSFDSDSALTVSSNIFLGQSATTSPNFGNDVDGISIRADNDQQVLLAGEYLGTGERGLWVYDSGENEILKIGTGGVKIESPDFTSGSISSPGSGWKVWEDGSAEFYNVTVRGDLSADDISAGSLSISYITDEGDLAHKDAVDETDITIDGDLSITGSVTSDDWDGYTNGYIDPSDATTGWTIADSAERYNSTDSVMAAEEFVDIDGGTIIGGGTFQGYRVIEQGTAGTLQWGDTYDSTKRWVNIWSSKSVTVPSNKNWIVIAHFAPTGTIDTGFATQVNPAGHTRGVQSTTIDKVESWEVSIGGFFVDPSTDESIGAILESGSHTVDLNISNYKRVSGPADDLWSTQRAYYQILEVPANAVG